MLIDLSVHWDSSKTLIEEKEHKITCSLDTRQQAHRYGSVQKKNRQNKTLQLFLFLCRNNNLFTTDMAIHRKQNGIAQLYRFQYGYAVAIRYNLPLLNRHPEHYFSIIIYFCEEEKSERKSIFSLGLSSQS